MMVAAVLMPTISFRDESIHADWQVLSRDELKKKILVKQKSMIQFERDISMDLKSIRSLSLSGSMRRNNSFDMIRLPAMSPPRDLDVPLPLPLQPVRTKYVSRSLPNSTAASPRQCSGQMRSIKNKEQASSSASYKRSKSFGATSKRMSLRNTFFIKTESNKSINNNNTLEDGFKCNALCLYLPGFGEGKPIRSSWKDDSSSFTRTTKMTTSSSSSITVSRTVSVRETSTTSTTTFISARASMENFDCNSYASEAAGEGVNGNHFFDLPSELIKSGSSDNDQDDPVSAAFVFDKEPIEKEIKGVLKISGSKNRKSMESSPRHVRFSKSTPVSYPTSPAISPRILEASKNFNAFLEAQAV